MNEEYRKLYEAVSAKFDIGTYDDFIAKMQTEEQRKRFYDVVSQKGFTLGDYDQYEGRLKKKEDTQPSTTTLQPTGDTTPQQQEVSQQDTQFPSWRDVQPPVSTAEQQDVTSVQQQPNIMGEKARQARESYAFNVVSQELDNIDNLKTQQQPTNTFEYGKQFLKDREGAPKQKTQEESLQEIDNQIKTLYPNLQTKGVDEDGNEVYTEDFTKGIGAIYLSEQQRQQQAIDEQRARVTEYENVHPIFKPLLTVANATDALFFDIASLATQMVGAEELTQGLRDQANKYQQEGSALKMSSGITQEQLENGAFATMGEDPIAAFKLLGYQTVEAIPSMAAIVLAPEVSVGRTGALQVGRSAAQQFVTPMSTNVYKETLKQASKTLGTRSNAGITALAGLEARSSYEEALNSGLTQAEALGISMIKGTAVYATEHVFMGAEDMVRNSLMNFGEEAAKKEIKQSVKDFVKEAGEQFTKEGLLEEGTPNLIGQILDNLTQGKPFNIYSYLDESAVGGLMGVGSVTTKAVLDNTSNLVSTTLTNSKLKQVGKQIRALREELLKQDLTPQERKLIEAELVATQKEYEKVKRSSDDMINMFTNEEKKRYIEINRELLSINDEFQKTENEAVKKILTDKANKLQQEKQAIEQKYSNQEVTNQEVTKEAATPIDVPKKFASSQKQADKEGTEYKTIGIDEIDLEKSGLEWLDEDGFVSKVIVLEQLGVNFDGIPVGKVRIVSKNGAENFDVFFKKKQATPPAQETPTETPATTTTSEENLSQKSATLATEEIDVYRGVGQNVAHGDNAAFTWVAEDENVARNYADSKENVKKITIKKPKNPFRLPYKLATDVRASNIGNIINSEINKAKRSGKISKEKASELVEKKRKFEEAAGENLELFSTKINKDGANVLFKEILSELGYDAIVQSEAASLGGNKTETYGIFKEQQNDTQAQQQVRGTQQQGKQDVGKPQQQKESDETTRSDRDKQEATEKEVSKTDFLSSLEKGTDSALAWLEEQEKQLDKFGKETLGMNLPVAVAKIAVQAAKVAVKAGKTGLEVIKAAKDAVVNGSWYKALKTQKEKDDALLEVEKLFKQTSPQQITIQKMAESAAKADTDLKKAEKELRFWNKLYGRKGRWFGFSTRAVSKIVQQVERVESMMSELSMNSKDVIRGYSKEVKKTVSQYAKKNNTNQKESEKEVQDLINAVLSPKEYGTTASEAFDALYEYSPKLANMTVGMRAHIDSLTAILLSDPSFDSLAEETKKDIEENLGNYIHRTYLFFLNKKYEPTEKVKANAYAARTAEILANDPTKSVDEAFTEAKEYIDELIESWNKVRNPVKLEKGKSSASDIKARDNALKARTRKPINTELWEDSLKQAQQAHPKLSKRDHRVLAMATEIYEANGGLFTEIPQYLRELLGEVKEPVSRYMNTMIAMGELVYKNQAMKAIADRYMGGLVLTSEPTRHKNEYVLVNDKYSPLNGMYVHESVLKEFEREPLYKTNLTLLKWYYSLQNFIRRVKIFGGTAWAKNILGGYYFQALNGEFIAFTDPLLAAKSAKGRARLITKGDRDAFTKQLWEEASKAGVLASGVDITTLAYAYDLYRHIEDGNVSMAKTALGKLAEKTKRFSKKLADETGRRYAQTDDYTKAVMVYTKKNEVAQMLYGKDYESLTQEEKNNVLMETGNMVKIGTPTFSRLPSWFKSVAKAPTGDFQSFRLEAFRSFIGAVHLLKQHSEAAIRGKDSEGNTLSKEQRAAYAKSAARRALGIASIVGINKVLAETGFGIAQNGISWALSSLFGGDDDDEEKLALNKRVMELSPEWTEGHSTVVRDIKKDGTVSFYDYTMYDPYSETVSLFFGNAKPMGEFFEPSMLFDMGINAYNGQDDFGNRIWTEEDARLMKLMKGGSYVLETGLMPPIVASMTYGAKQMKESDPDWGGVGDYAMLGMQRMTVRDYNFNIYKKATNLLYDVNDKSRAPKLTRAKNFDDIKNRINNLDKARKAIQIVQMHYLKNSDVQSNAERVEAMNKAIKSGLNFTKEERDFLFMSDEEFAKASEYMLKNYEKQLELNEENAKKK